MQLKPAGYEMTTWASHIWKVL